MSLAVIKNKTEEAMAADAAKRIAMLPAGSDLRKAREEAAQRFNASGLPHRRIEEWKYTDLRALLKGEVAPGSTSLQLAEKLAVKMMPGLAAVTLLFVDGKLASKPDGSLPAGMTVQSFAVTAEEVMPFPQTLDAGADAIISLNTALASDGAVITIAQGAKVDKPIHAIFISSGRVAVRNMISLGAGAEATIIETHVSAEGGTRQETSVACVRLESAATLHHITSVDAADGSAFLAQSIVHVADGAVYNPFQFFRGEGLTRQQMTLTFAGENSAVEFAAAALVRGAGHSDTTLVIDHAVPHCTSRELFKTVLDDRARSIFQGKVIVRPDAQKTDGKQMAQALMLSPDAEFDSKPELEIYADDVVCGHGTTSAEIDSDMLFYCKSRGIPEAQARALLIESFVGEAIDKVANDAVRESLMSLARDWLHAAQS